MGVHQTDVWVMLHPKEQWPTGSHLEELKKRLEDDLMYELPGVAFGFTQPIEMRVDELVAGVKADVAALVYGDDLKELSRIGKEIAQILRNIPGSADVKRTTKRTLQHCVSRSITLPWLVMGWTHPLSCSRSARWVS